MAPAPGHAQHRHRGFDGFGTEASVQQAVNTLGPRLRRGLRYSMLDADHVVRVGVMAQEFDCMPRELRRVAVLSGPAGKEPSPFAVRPPGADAAPLQQQQLLHMWEVVELERACSFGVVRSVVEFETWYGCRVSQSGKICDKIPSCVAITAWARTPLVHFSAISPRASTAVQR